MSRPDDTRGGPLRAAPVAAARLPPGAIALFLDLDGTLVEFVQDPAGLRVDPALVALLARLHDALGGALAIVSGRPIAELDRLLQPLLLPVAGVHGYERRDAAGQLLRRGHPTGLEAVRAALRSALAGLPGAVLEDKGSALALHYRNEPGHRELMERLVDRYLESLGPDFERIDGDCVVEIKPSGSDKGVAVSAFMSEDPFRDRVPVYVGDDITDSDAFAAVRRHGGIAIAVGDRVDAPHRLRDPQAVRRWLERLPLTADVRP